MKNILIVDDNEILRKSMEKILNDQYSVFHASNGIEAVSSLKKNNIDLIFLDVVMPEKGGIAVLMDSKDLLKNKKIVIITGNVSPDSDAFKSLSKSFGVSKILYKPFEKEELLNTVKETLI